MTLKCPYDNCNTKTTRIGDLRRHMSDKHLKCSVWECPFCSVAKTQAFNIVRHMRCCDSRPTVEDDTATAEKPRHVFDDRWEPLRKWNPKQPLPDELKIRATVPVEEDRASWDSLSSLSKRGSELSPSPSCSDATSEQSFPQSDTDQAGLFAQKSAPVTQSSDSLSPQRGDPRRVNQAAQANSVPTEGGTSHQVTQHEQVKPNDVIQFSVYDLLQADSPEVDEEVDELIDDD